MIKQMPNDLDKSSISTMYVITGSLSVLKIRDALMIQMSSRIRTEEFTERATCRRCGCY